MTVLPLAFLVLATPFQPAQENPKFVDMWDKAARAIETRYYARASRGEAMKSLLAKYGPMAKAAKNEADFNQVMDRMIAEFGDSHFDFLTPSDQGYYMMDNLGGGKEVMPQIGAWFKEGKDGYTVQMVLNGGPAEKAGLMKGDLMLSVDGKPFGPVDSFKGKADQEVSLKFRHSGLQIEKSVEVRETTALQMFLQATKDSARIIEHGGKKYGYMHVWTHASEDFKTTLHNAVYGMFRDTDGFILDIRDGFGGRPEGYGDPFFRPEVMLDWKTSPTSGFKQLFGYGRPLVVLINGGSRSAKEVLAYVFKKSKRGTLIGSTTAGHVLGTSPMRLSDWAMIEIPMVDVIADGFRIEGKGVDPDIALPKEFDEQGKDLYIERALQQLNAQVTK